MWASGQRRGTALSAPLMTMQVAKANGGQLPKRTPKSLPPGVLALDGWANRFIVLSNWFVGVRRCLAGDQAPPQKREPGRMNRRQDAGGFFVAQFRHLAVAMLIRNYWPSRRNGVRAYGRPPRPPPEKPQ